MKNMSTDKKTNPKSDASTISKTDT
jgi:tetratricopeptide (TPR) repeat protein